MLQGPLRPFLNRSHDISMALSTICRGMSSTEMAQLDIPPNSRSTKTSNANSGVLTIKTQLTLFANILRVIYLVENAIKMILCGCIKFYSYVLQTKKHRNYTISENKSNTTIYNHSHISSYCVEAQKCPRNQHQTSFLGVHRDRSMHVSQDRSLACIQKEEVLKLLLGVTIIEVYRSINYLQYSLRFTVIG